ncbi:MAG: hypothetical protein AABM67_10525 [Acidobacteriota bacterium]
MLKNLIIMAALACFTVTAHAQSPEFNEPWKDPRIALAIDPFEGNPIDWDALATDPRVVAIIHRATIWRSCRYEIR